MKDYYQILGVERDAGAEEIKKAFRRLALKHHPDRNPGDKGAEERFKEMNEAYSCLSDPEKRMSYDRFGTAKAPAFEPFGGGFGDIFENIFGDFFGFPGGRATQRPARGSDLRYDLDITLEEAAFGVEKIIEVPRWESCTQCGGSGSKGRGPVDCPNCKGSGHVRFQKGFFTVSQTCGKCQGEGKIITDPCGPCNGQGRLRRSRKLMVSVPAGVDNGSRLKLHAEGEFGFRSGPPGDLFVVIHLQEHPVFRREGVNILCEVPLGFAQAVLGAEIEVMTLEGPHKLKIPSGTQPGGAFKLKGMGIPRLGSRARGDQIVIVNLTVPRHITDRQRDILEEFERLDASETQKSFKDKLKGIFTGTA